VAVAVGNQRGLPLAIWVVGFADAMGKNAVPEIVAETGRAAVRLRESLDRRSQDES